MCFGIREAEQLLQHQGCRSIAPERITQKQQDDTLLRRYASFGADHWAHRCDQCRHPAAARDREVGRASIERGVTKARYCAKCSIETVACSNFREFKNLAGKANAVTGLCEGTHGSISVDDTAVRPKQCDAVGQPFNRIFKYFTAFGAGFETPCHVVRALIVRT